MVKTPKTPQSINQCSQSHRLVELENPVHPSIEKGVEQPQLPRLTIPFARSISPMLQRQS